MASTFYLYLQYLCLHFTTGNGIWEWLPLSTSWGTQQSAGGVVTWEEPVSLRLHWTTPFNSTDLPDRLYKTAKITLTPNLPEEQFPTMYLMTQCLPFICISLLTNPHSASFLKVLPTVLLNAAFKLSFSCPSGGQSLRAPSWRFLKWTFLPIHYRTVWRQTPIQLSHLGFRVSHLILWPLSCHYV